MFVEYYIFIGLIALSLVIWAWGARNRRNLKLLEQEKRAIMGEEERMFHFLHDLGEAIEKDTSQLRVNRMIVDGVVKVVDAKGGQTSSFDFKNLYAGQ